MYSERIHSLKLYDSFLVMGVCSRGPYRYAEDNFRNPEVNWISWGYSSEYINPDVLQKIKSNEILSGTEVIFASWSINVDKKAKSLRKGIIDHIILREGYVGFTIFLKDILSGFIKISEKGHYLCRFIDKKCFIQ